MFIINFEFAIGKHKPKDPAKTIAKLAPMFLQFYRSYFEPSACSVPPCCPEPAARVVSPFPPRDER